jgi:molybdenum cofactor cytidylyltransferase
MNIRGILLAAGASRRFGGNKLVHPLPDDIATGEAQPLALASARKLLGVLPHTLAVVRPGSDELQAVLRAAGCEVSVCPRADEGMGCSLAHAIAQSPDADAWVVALADMPYIAASSIEAVVTALQAGALIAMPVHEGRRGHPVGFAAALRKELLALEGDEGARRIVQGHLAASQGDAGTALHLIPVNDEGIVRDIDTRADLPVARAGK